MNGFSAGGTGLDNTNYYTAAGTTTVSNVSTYNAFNIFREDNITIQSFLYKGNEVFYDLIGTLPTGLTFDKSNGQISGTPVEFSATKSLTIRAYNAASDFTSLPTADFDLKITEHFEILNETENATSFILHKEGQGRVRSRCMITQEQIDGTDQAAKDIICYVDAGELDLYKSGLKLKANVGKGVCEHFQYFPYYFYQYQYKRSTIGATTTPGFRREFTKTISDGGCVSTAEVITADPGTTATATELSKKQYCASEYTLANKDAPNCDDGEYQLTTTTYAIDSVTTLCTPTPTIETLNCTGKKSNCVAGPAQQDGLDTDFYNSVIISSDLGLNKLWTYAAPITKGYATNLSLANYVNKNKCDVVAGNSYAYNAQYWGDHITNSYTRLTQYTDPFMQSNPFYTFACLDSGFDIRARIRIMVREWDKDFKMTDGIDLSNPGTSVMDVVGTDLFGNNYNNRVDWDDVGAVLPGTCSAPAAGTGGLINTTPSPNTTNFTTQFAFPGAGL
jgi:hypothetical protein